LKILAGSGSDAKEVEKLKTDIARKEAEIEKLTKKIAAQDNATQ
jgi:hypothetical protein